jgi:hypothetical protein
MEIVYFPGALVLLAALIYGVLQYHYRNRATYVRSRTRAISPLAPITDLPPMARNLFRGRSKFFA